MKTAKRWTFNLFLLMLLSCGAQKPTAESGLYEVLTRQSDGGGNIHFYEILTTQKEVSMLSSDELLKRKVNAQEADTATFVILNMGEKPSGGYGIDIESVVEIPERIIVTIKESTPEPGSMNTMSITYPYTVIKINSKKPVEIR